MTTRRSRAGGTYVVPPSRGDCPSGKMQFAQRKQARAAARNLNASSLGVYRCPSCDWFHVGNMPERVRNGEVDKAAWLRATRGGAS